MGHHKEAPECSPPIRLAALHGAPWMLKLLLMCYRDCTAHIIFPLLLEENTMI